MNSVSIYFFAGDFVDVLKRYDAGLQQIYQTHNEVARLIYDLINANYKVSIYSFVTPQQREDRPIEGLRIISLGAKNYSATSLLAAAVEKDSSQAIVAHFANLELLRAVKSTKSRAIAILANSYNNTGLRAFFGKRQVVTLLNNKRFELVSNHCLPATEHLGLIGVKREKLIAWDVPHPFDPALFKAKQLRLRRPFEAMYVGSIAEGKGVSDLISALALLREKGMDVRCSFAGLGDIDAMRTLAKTLDISDLVNFLGLIGNEDVFNMMAVSDVVIVPSRIGYPEGFPLTMFEAVASRTPIVCSNHPMFRPVLLDGRNAAIFRAGDPQALAAAILRILENPTLYATLSVNAVATWNALKGPADWRTLIIKWVTEGVSSPWLHERMLTAKK